MEKDCFETFARETAEFFSVKTKWLSTATSDNNNASGGGGVTDDSLSTSTEVDVESL